MFNFKNFGNYPAEYDAKVHGPYDPARYYGKKDIPFGDVKLQELGSWFSRRNKSPGAMVSAVSRGWWRWQHKYRFPKYSGLTPYTHIVVGCMLFFYIINYGKIRYHKNFKYQW